MDATFSSEQFPDFAQANHLRRGRAGHPGGAHFFDNAVFKHCFYPLIDSVVKLLPVAKNKDTCSRGGALSRGRRAEPVTPCLRETATTAELGLPVSKQISSARKRRRRLLISIFRASFGIELLELRAQIVQAHGVQFSRSSGSDSGGRGASPWVSALM